MTFEEWWSRWPGAEAADLIAPIKPIARAAWNDGVKEGKRLEAEQHQVESSIQYRPTTPKRD